MNKREIELERAKLLENIDKKLDKIIAIISIEPPAAQHKKIKKRNKKEEERLKAGF